MSSYWLEYSLVRSWKKNLLERNTPSWGIPTKACINHGTCFSEQILRTICKICLIIHNFHFSDDLQSFEFIMK